MVVRASAVARSSGSYSLTAHAPTRIQFVKLGGASRGSLVSPARKLLRLSFAGSSLIGKDRRGDLPGDSILKGLKESRRRRLARQPPSDKSRSMLIDN